MKKRKFNYEGAVKGLLLYITKAIEKGERLSDISQGLRRIVNSYIGLNRNERYDLYYEAYSVARALKRHVKDGKWKKNITQRQTFDKVYRASRRVKSASELREKKKRTREALNSATIFFLTSSHKNPAEDHKDYEGLLCVDRFWRQKVSGSEYYAVLSYIKNHNIKYTVQELCGAPVWFTTRPNCKHYFIPLDTDDVLHKSVRKIIDRHRAKDITEEYYRIRSELYSEMNDLVPSDEFRKAYDRYRA